MKFELLTFFKRAKKDPANKAQKKSKPSGASQPGQLQQPHLQKQENKKDPFQQPKHKGTFYTYNNNIANSNDHFLPSKTKHLTFPLHRQDDTTVPLTEQADRWIHVNEPLPAPLFPDYHTVFSGTSHDDGNLADDVNADSHNHESFLLITLMFYAPQTMENACVREIRQINPDIVILRDAAWIQVLRSLGYRTHGHVHYRPDKFTVFSITGRATYQSPAANNDKNSSSSKNFSHLSSSINNSSGTGDAREHLQRGAQAAVVLQSLKTWDRIIVSPSGSVEAGVVDLAAHFQPVQGTSRDNNKLCMPVIVTENVSVKLPLLSLQQQKQQQNHAQTCLSLKETAGFWYSDTTLALDEYLETEQGNEFVVRFRLRTGISSQYHNCYLAA